MNMNLAVLVGRSCTEVELRYTPGGLPVSTFTIAIDKG